MNCQFKRVSDHKVFNYFMDQKDSILIVEVGVEKRYPDIYNIKNVPNKNGYYELYTQQGTCYPPEVGIFERIDCIDCKPLVSSNPL